MRQALRSLEGRNLRLYFSGQFVSFVGTWVQQVALAWIAYRITGSPLVLGLVVFCNHVPALVLGPLAGVLADRYPRLNILIATQTLELLVAACLVYMASIGALTGQSLVWAALVLGIGVALAMPARQAMIAEMVERDGHLANAIALNSVSFNIARLVGPACGAAILAAFGDVACFAVNAASYVVEICALLMIRVVARVPPHERGSLRQGLAYLRGASMPRWLLLTVACSGAALAPLVTLLPVFAKQVFGGGIDSLGTLLACSGLGSLMAGLALANRRYVSGLSLKVVVGCLCGGASAAIFSWNQHFPTAVALMIVSGWSTVMIVTSSHILLQSLIPDHLRGRVMAFFGMAYGGALSFASLASGALAGWFGARPLILLSAVLYLGIGLLLNRALPAIRVEARSILVAKGLVPK